jgi:hypothetical protein
VSDLNPNLISIRHVRAAGRIIPVELSRNAGGSIAARCHLGATDTPIIDGPSEEEVLAAIEESLEGLLYARAAG